MAKNVLVTGHLGYIGPVVIRQLKARGHTVTGLDTGYFRDCFEPDAAPVAPDKEIGADIRDISVDMFEGVDAVIHLAGLSNDPLGKVAETMTDAINTRGTERAGSLAKEAGVRRFVFASSCSIYGAADGATAPLDETAPFAPVSAYARSKVDGEAILLGMKTPDFRPLMMRNATAYGVSARTRLDLVVGNLLARAIATGVVTVLSDGTPWRPMVHIEDIAAAAICAVEADDEELPYDAYNIARLDANYRVSEIAERIAAALPGVRIETTGETGGDPRSYQVDCTRAATHLPGFSPEWTLERGIEQTRDWISALPRHALDELLGPRYVRLAQLQAHLDAGRLDRRFRWANS